MHSKHWGYEGMEAKYKLSPEDIAAIEETLSKGKYVEARLDKDRNIMVLEVERTIVAKDN